MHELKKYYKHTTYTIVTTYAATKDIFGFISYSFSVRDNESLAGLCELVCVCVH